MRISQTGIDLIKKFEGCNLTAYKCPAGVWTIGYGHTSGVMAGQTISQAQAEAYLIADLSRYEKNVEKYSKKYTWSQNEFDAMVSFAYNIGSIDKLTANGTRTKAVIAEKILLYNKAGGKVLESLNKRRYAERELFLNSDSKTVEITKGKSGSGIVEYSLKADGEKQICKNFKVKEFRCKDGSDMILIDEDFVKNKLQAIRDHFGASVTIDSAYRTESYNKKVNGAKSSYHMKGQAFDIVVKGHTPLEVARYAQTIGITGIIQYNTFVHVDSRPAKYWARNDAGKVTVKSGF
ncbi:MAG: D-Ala-D-Ala carboxypeptidase family metallohydrolase [Bacillus sp. (in: Bacteria)]|nr:D-Ala-D-Ala carboxypeptidase family metallohydrolase [Bacillus sp. (in: firmicutes)]MCM1428068.1 D-Ala-D-Ala carboxypeptidase family metallohydrolase [Eubacterium sp.]